MSMVLDTRTGWPPGLLQDDDKGLSKALASTPGAMLHAREAAAAIQIQACRPEDRAMLGTQAGAELVKMATAALADEQPTLNLGQIVERIGVIVSADLLTRLGFIATRDKSSRLFHERDFPAICAALAAHILAVGEAHQ